jgi:hypothetical protein
MQRDLEFVPYQRNELLFRSTVLRTADTNNQIVRTALLSVPLLPSPLRAMSDLMIRLRKRHVREHPSTGTLTLFFTEGFHLSYSVRLNPLQRFISSRVFPSLREENLFLFSVQVTRTSRSITTMRYRIAVFIRNLLHRCSCYCCLAGLAVAK